MTNGGFEWDTNGDGRPDDWTSNSKFARSTLVVRGDSYAGKHYATNNSSYTISQVVSGLTAGQTYNASGWVNIPPTTDTFTFNITIQWRNSSNTVLRTDTIKVYSRQTNGWDSAMASLIAPTGTTNAQIQMIVNSLNATIYIDDLALQP